MFALGCVWKGSWVCRPLMRRVFGRRWVRQVHGIKRPMHGSSQCGMLLLWGIKGGFTINKTFPLGMVMGE